MSKELFVSLTPHETKLAITEDEQLAEIYFERENEYTLAGSIYKGRVNRVLPGMQSAFVDIGLERDAFLYVSDFFELPDEEEEFEPVAVNRGSVYRPEAPAEAHVQAMGGARPEAGPAAAEEEAAQETEEAPEAAEAVPQATNEAQPRNEEGERGSRLWRGRNRRRRGRRGRGGADSRFAPADPAADNAEPEHHGERRYERPRPEYGPPPGYQPIILPGESISKYQHMAPPPVVMHPPEPAQAAGEGIPTEEQSAPPAAETREELNQEHAAGAYAAWTADTAERSAEPGSSEVSGQASLQPDDQRPESRSAAAQEERAAEKTTAASLTIPEFAPRAAQRPLEAEQPLVEEVEEMAGEEEEEAEQHTESASGAVEAAGQALVEEEIEEEETELPPLTEEFEDSEYEEMEEQTIEPDGSRAEVMAGSEEGPEETEEDRAEAEAYAQRESEGEAAAGPAEEGSRRAEMRGTAGTAGYQQRAERREFERGRRGRRGGRRMRQTRSLQRQHVMIADVLKEGQEVLVQIAKEPIGKKGARITSHIALPGRFLVYMPTVNHIGVSRKIDSEEERQRLKRIVSGERDAPGHGGFIVRTAAQNVSEEELKADIRFLKNLWSEIKNRADNSKSPALIYHDLNLVERVLRDQVTEDFSHIWVDSEQEYERILRFVNRFQPALVRRVRLYTKDTPLFEQFNIQEEINKALKSKVWLKSGGYIVINQTEALVAIDVNTGKYVGKTTRLEDTIVKTNVDAIKEIVRQIRLRDLGGIIVIDFIDMDERRNRQKVMQALEEALKSDRAPSKVLQFNDFGLVAITRKRVKHSLERTLGVSCPYCTGTGVVKSVDTVCNEIFTELRKMSKHLEEKDITLRVNPDVAKALKANNARWLNDYEELISRTVIVKPDATLHQEQFDII